MGVLSFSSLKTSSEVFLNLFWYPTTLPDDESGQLFLQISRSIYWILWPLYGPTYPLFFCSLLTIALELPYLYLLKFCSHPWHSLSVPQQSKWLSYFITSSQIKLLHGRLQFTPNQDQEHPVGLWVPWTWTHSFPDLINSHFPPHLSFSKHFLFWSPEMFRAKSSPIFCTCLFIY